MDIKTFIEQMTGDWFTQRTLYQFATMTEENGKSNVGMVLLSLDDPAIAPFCAQVSVDPALVWGGIRITWETSGDLGQPAQPPGESLMLLLAAQVGANPAPPQQEGHFLCSGMTQVGQYCLGEDEVLNLTLQTEGEVTLTDRVWFATANLRFRTSVVARAGVPQQTLFYSEIRRMKS